MHYIIKPKKKKKTIGISKEINNIKPSLSMETQGFNLEIGIKEKTHI